jgi:hypothetical protein
MAGVGVQSALNVQTSPVVPNASSASQPHFWTYFWFILAVLTVIGFHIRIFGRPVPPAANFP